MPAPDTLDIVFHADQTVTIDGVTVPSGGATPLLEAAVLRTPAPVLRFIRDEGSGYESVGHIIYQAVRAGFPDHSFSLLGRKPRPTLRPATPDDVPFLLDLRHQSMDAVLLASGHTLSDQAHLQRVQYAFEWAHIVQLAGVPVGLLKVVRTAPVWELVQIQLAPSVQGQGLGEQLLRTLMAEAMAAGASVKLGVLKVNPALHLYERLGFIVIGETDDAYHMLFTVA